MWAACRTGVTPVTTPTAGVSRCDDGVCANRASAVPGLLHHHTPRRLHRCGPRPPSATRPDRDRSPRPDRDRSPGRDRRSVPGRARPGLRHTTCPGRMAESSMPEPAPHGTALRAVTEAPVGRTPLENPRRAARRDHVLHRTPQAAATANAGSAVPARRARTRLDPRRRSGGRSTASATIDPSDPSDRRSRRAQAEPDPTRPSSSRQHRLTRDTWIDRRCQSGLTPSRRGSTRSPRSHVEWHGFGIRLERVWPLVGATRKDPVGHGEQGTGEIDGTHSSGSAGGSEAPSPG